MLKGKLSMLIVFSLIVALTGSLGVFLAINMSKAGKVSKTNIEFYIEGESKVYDGLPLELDINNLYLVDENALPSGYTYEFICNDTITNAGIIYPTPSISIYDKEGKNVTGYYNCIIKENGGLKVEPRELNIEFKNTTKRFDGQPLNKAEYSVSGSLVLGHKISPIYKSEATNVGEAVNIEADVWVVDNNGGDVTKNYAINDNLSGENIPTFLIEGRVLSIELKTIEKTYDGYEFGKEDITSSDYVCSGLDIENGHMVIIKDFECEDEIIDVRSRDYSFTIPTDQIEVIDMNGREVTSEYEIRVKPGKIRINPRNIVLTEKIEQEAEFDGLPHRLVLSDNELNSLISPEDKEALGSSKIMSGEAGEFIKVGEYASKLVIEKSNGDIDANFTIDSEQAKLIIKKRVVKFTKKSDAITEKSFDSENYNLFVAEDIYETTDTAFSYLLSFPTGTFNEPKDYKAHDLLSIVAVGLNNEYKEYVEYDIEEVILKATVSLEEVHFNIINSIKVNDYRYTHTFDGKRVKASELFELTKEVRTYLTTNRYTMEFDFVAGYYGSSSSLLTTRKIVDCTDEILVATMYDEFHNVVETYEGEKCIINCEENDTDIYVSIGAISYYVKTKGAEKVYDGEALSCHEYEIIGLPEGYVEILISDTEETYYNGEGEMNMLLFSITYGGFEADGCCVCNFEACSWGNLVIKKATLIVEVDNLVITYGDYNDVDDIPINYTKSGNGKELVGLNIVVIKDLIEPNAGTYNNIYADVDSYTLDMDSINVEVIPGQLTIKKKAITLQSATITKTYDGNILPTRSTVINGYDVYYLQSESYFINAGTYQNEFEINVNNPNNYDITYIFGTITINPKKIILQSEDLSKPYDGNPFTRGSYIQDLNSGSEYYVSYITNPTDAGTYTNSFVLDSSYNSDNYDVTYVYGTLTITPKKIVVITNSFTKSKNNISYSDYSITVPDEYGLDIDSCTIIDYMYRSGNVYQVGEYDNIVYLNDTNYEVVSYIYGKITITE